MSAPPAPGLWRAFLAFLGPMILANALQSLSGTANTILLGHMLGVRALAAASVFFPLLFLFIAFIIGLGAGASVLIGQAWGAGERQRVREVAGSVIAVALGLGLLAALVGGLRAGALMRAFGTPPDILADATAYARVMLLASPPLFVFLLATSLLRGVGDTVTPLRALVLSTATGLVLTPLLIAGPWPFGVTAPAYASAASFTLALAWLAWRLRRRGHALAPDAALLREIRWNWPILARVLRIGVPTGVQLVTVAVAEMALLGIANGFGAAATAAYGAVNQVIAYVQFPAISITITVSVFGAQAIGAGRPERLAAITRTGLLLNLVLTGALVLLGYAMAPLLVAAFITDPLVAALTLGLLRIVLWSMVPFGMAGVLAGTMRASGTVLVPMALQMAAIVLVEIPVAWLLSARIGVAGVWYAYPAAFTAMLLLQAGFYLLVWRHRPIVRLI
jgi:putative MATE family efflux protein